MSDKFSRTLLDGVLNLFTKGQLRKIVNRRESLTYDSMKLFLPPIQRKIIHNTTQTQ